MGELRVFMLAYNDDDGEFETRGAFVLPEGSNKVEIEEGLPPEAVGWMRQFMVPPINRIKGVDADGEVMDWVTPESDPEAWMRGLPFQYSGTKLRAELEDSDWENADPEGLEDEEDEEGGEGEDEDEDDTEELE